jgi:hypothetical protein
MSALDIMVDSWYDLAILVEIQMIKCFGSGKTIRSKKRTEATKNWPRRLLTENGYELDQNLSGWGDALMLMVWDMR